MGSSVSRSKSIKVESEIQAQYFKDTISRQKKELKENCNKIVSLEKELAVGRQELSQCQTDLKLSKQEILYKTKEVSSLSQEIHLIRNPSLQKKVLRGIFTISIGMLDLCAAILYGYAINKITETIPDKSAEILISLAAILYAIAQVVQIFNAGRHH